MTAARSVSLLGALLVMMVLTRILDEAEYGQYQKLWLLFTVLSPGIINTAVQTLYYRGGSESDGNPFWVTTLFVCISGFVISVFTYFASAEIAQVLNAPDLALAFQHFAVYMFFATIAGIGEPIFILIERKKWLLGYNIIYNLIDASLVIIPFLMGYPLEQVILFMIAGPALRSAFLLTITYFHAPEISRNRFSEEISASWSYAQGIIVLSVIALLIFEADKIIVGIFMDSDADFATYVVGAKKIPFLTALIASVSSAFIVQYAKTLSSETRAEAIPAIRHTANRLFILILPATLFGLLYSEEILVLLFEKYAHSAPIFRIYILAMITNIFISDTVILGAGHSHITARISFAELLLNIVFSIILIIPLGLIGPAIATVISRVINVLLCNWYCSYKYGFSTSIFFPVDGAKRIILALIVILTVYGAAILLTGNNWVGFGLTGATTLGITIWQNKNIGRTQQNA